MNTISTLPDAISFASQPVCKVKFQFFRFFSGGNRIVHFIQVRAEPLSELFGVRVTFVSSFVLFKPEFRRSNGAADIYALGTK